MRVGFTIAGLPAFLPSIITALLSMIPYFGAYLVWFPCGVYLLFIGHICKRISAFMGIFNN
jgi:predicted PurR-regulated permease PerM